MINIILLGVGGICLAITGFFFLKTKKFLATGKIVKGKITDVIEKQSEHEDNEGFRTRSTTYCPVVEFQTESGEKITFESNVGVTNSKSYQIGQVVEVVYNPTKPQEAKINSFIQLWLIPIIFGLVGVILLVVGAVV